MQENEIITTIKKNWNSILASLQNDWDMTPVSIDTWCRSLVDNIYAIEDGVVIFALDEMPMVNILRKKYGQYIKASICELTEIKLDVDFRLRKDLENMKHSEKNKAVSSYINAASKSGSKTNLNPKYTFDTFVVGSNNNFAHAACLAVAESPGEVYNPLFIYGGVGLGKTHLMQSIAHFVINSDADKKVTYITSEEFMNEMIDAIKNQKNREFREKYRNVDVLLIDDIQFISNRESTQEEFFHTFNTLYGSNKQIVISSDRPPKELTKLEDRIRTRFEQGLQVDIKPPTYETSMAILDKKIEAEGYSVPYEVKDFIVNNINSNIRELEGALTKITAYSKLSNNPITLEMAQDMLKDLISPNAKREVTIEYIIQVVADHFGIPIVDIISAKRKADIVYPRQIAMYLCRTCTQEPLTSIGKVLGNRDHTTVIHGAEKIEEEIKNDEKTKNVIDILIKKINPS